MDVLSVMMSNATVYSTRIKEVFDSALGREQFKKSPKQYARLVMTKGIYGFLMRQREREDAVEDFLKAYAVDKDVATEFLKVRTVFA